MNDPLMHSHSRNNSHSSSTICSYKSISNQNVQSQSPHPTVDDNTHDVNYNVQYDEKRAEV